MIQNDHNSAFAKLSALRLSSESRARMRAELSAYADFHAASPRAAVRSPFGLSAAIPTFFARGFALSLILVMATGTAAASTPSLPGDILYPIKTRVAEPVQTVLIPTAEGKASFQASLASRRLEEATQLAVMQQLDPVTEQQLAEDFEAHVEKSLSVAEEIKAEGDVQTSLAIRSDLEAKVTAHKDILEMVVATLATTTAITDMAQPATEILKSVASAKETVQAQRIEAEVTLAATTTTVIAAVVAAADEAASTASSATADVSADGAAPAAALAAEASAAAEVAPVVTGVPGTPAAAAIAAAGEDRAREVASILEKHAGLLVSIGAPAVTAPAATSTGLTLPAATTTQEVITQPAPPVPASAAPAPVPTTLPTLKQNVNLFRGN